jgi:hypothetical protein
MRATSGLATAQITSFTAGGTEGWGRDARVVAAELTAHLDARPTDLRLRYGDLVGDLEGTARALAARLNVELDPRCVGRPAEHVTTPSAAASVGRSLGPGPQQCRARRAHVRRRALGLLTFEGANPVLGNAGFGIQ